MISAVTIQLHEVETRKLGEEKLWAKLEGVITEEQLRKWNVCVVPHALSQTVTRESIYRLFRHITSTCRPG